MKVIEIKGESVDSFIVFLSTFGSLIEDEDIDEDISIDSECFIKTLSNLAVEYAVNDLLPDAKTAELIGAYAGSLYTMLFHKDIKTEKEEK